MRAREPHHDASVERGGGRAFWGVLQRRRAGVPAPTDRRSQPDERRGELDHGQVVARELDAPMSRKVGQGVEDEGIQLPGQGWLHAPQDLLAAVA